MIIFEKKLIKGTFKVYSQKPSFPLTEVKQVHGNHVSADEESSSQVESDGIYSLKESFTLAIKTADCLPIVVIGEKGVAHLHAGWRGVQSRIFLEKKILKLKPYYFFIGPHIQKESFEVTKEFYQHFPNSKELFHIKNGALYFDMSGQVKKEIASTLEDAIVEQSNIDTFSSPNFHSYRLNKTKKRNWNLYIP